MAWEFTHERCVILADTDAAGGVHFTSYFHWQDEARELALARFAPELMRVNPDFVFATVHTSCDLHHPLRYGDYLLIRISLTDAYLNLLKFRYDMFKTSADPQILIAEGRQTIAGLRPCAEGPQPAAFPESLRESLQRSGEDLSRLYTE